MCADSIPSRTTQTTREELLPNCIYLVWAFRDISLLCVMLPALQRLRANHRAREIVVPCLYVTGALDAEHEATASDVFGRPMVKLANGIRVSLGRPPLARMLAHMAGKHPNSKVGVFSCAPKEMTALVRSTVHDTNAAGPKVSSPAANALIYVSLVCFLAIGIVAGWRSHRNAGLFLKAIKSQSVLALTLNFLAVNIGSGIFFSLPQVGTIAGITGVFAYAFASGAPLFIFAVVGPLFRKHNSRQWSMTAFIMERYGRPLHLVYSLICTMFVGMYM
ncbi:hypothetical protein IWW47_005846, partial [Coemansia sp. RSA 2052]